MHKITIILLLLALTLPLGFAATIHGAVYDDEYNLIEDIQLEINSSPRQQFISKNGAYFFNVPQGVFKITVDKFYHKELIYTYTKLFEISKDGEFQIDIVVENFPDILEDKSDQGPSIFTLLLIQYPYLVYGGGVGMILFLVLVYFFFRKQKTPKYSVALNKEMPTHAASVNSINTSYSVEDRKEPIVEDHGRGIKDIIELIKSEGGRTTQKDIRKKFPLSEAKISLMITELESVGKIQKIKKGRGNVIVLR